MEQGIVCKVWNIQGVSAAKGAIDQLRDSIGYIMNEEKTSVHGTMDPLNQLTRECKYIEDDLKTFAGALVGGNNVISTNVADAVSEMMEIKRFYGKEKGRAALHMVISLPENESEFQNASKLMQLCNSVVKETFPNHQAVYAVHTNTENLHIHVIVNSVGVDGKKIHQNKQFMKNVLHPCVNKYASVYGFTQNPKWRVTEQKESSFPDLKIRLRSEIDQAIEQADSFSDFVKCLESKNIKLRIGKHLSISLPGMTKAIRTHQLGSNYTRDAIIDRIQTRKEKFERIISKEYAKPECRTVARPSFSRMPKYKDMTETQKKEVIRLLRLGRNPWREHRQRNWQLNRIADEMNAFERIQSYIEFYSQNNNLNEALQKMLEAKNQVAEDKKEIAHRKKKYKPILDIYDEMKQIEKKAYLYEHEDVREYRLEFEQYRNLTRRLKDGYNKDVFEVAAFLEECDERYLYAQAQEKEISAEYRELKKFARERGLIDNQSSLIDVLGFFEDKKNSQMNIGSNDAFYIASPHSDVIFRVMKYPSQDKYGNIVENYEIAILDRRGNVMQELHGDGRDRSFYKKLSDLQKELHMTECKQFVNLARAVEYGGEVTEPKGRTNRQGTSQYTFAQAINHVFDDRPTRVIMNAENPSYIALSSKEDHELSVVIFDQENDVKEAFRLPIVKRKNSDGYKKIVSMMDKYNFHDAVVEFNTLDEARAYRKQRRTEQLSAKLAESTRGKN